MRIKLDENIGVRGADILRAAGHEVVGVREQGLCSAGDTEVIGAAAGEGRCLVTLDIEFANPLLFHPRSYAGIAVLRLPHGSTADDLFEAMRTLSGGLDRGDIGGKLWVVQRGRIREYQPDDDKA